MCLYLFIHLSIHVAGLLFFTLASFGLVAKQESFEVIKKASVDLLSIFASIISYSVQFAAGLCQHTRSVQARYLLFTLGLQVNEVL